MKKNKILTRSDEWSYILCFSAVGLTYGTLTTLPELLQGCYGANSEAFCGMLAGLLNVPAMLFTVVILQTLQPSLYEGLWHFLGILLGDVLFFGFFGIVFTSMKPEKREEYLRRGFLMPILVLIALPLLFFFFLFIQ